MTVSWAAPVLALVIVSTLAGMPAGPAVAGPVPDNLQLALMRQAIARTRLVRVNGEFGTLRANRPWLDSSGVRLGERLGGRAGAMLITAASAGQIEPIPWQQISTIETDRAGTESSAVLGGLIGLLAGAVIVASNVEIDSYSLRASSPHSGAILLGTTAGGLALGFLIGQHNRSRTIYPPLSGAGR